jgi:predicted O-methyltransferase YrrM
MDMTPTRWENTSTYLRDVFGEQDDDLALLMDRAREQGLPDIAISPDVGRLLGILTSLAGSSSQRAQRALELGTLAGYSAIWIARSLAPGGQLITVEIDDHHADVAQSEFERAGVADRIEIIRKGALEALPEIASRFGKDAFDLIFFDAIKADYPAYFAASKDLLRSGGLLLADNALGSDWWIDEDLDPDSPQGMSKAGADQLNRLLAADTDFEAACVPIRQGIVIARKR